MKKFLIGMGICVGLFFGIFWSPVHAAQQYPTWTRDDNGWKLAYPDGSLYKNDWFYDIDTGIWYYMQDSGYVLTKAVSPDGLQVSASGRLIHPQELLKRIYHSEEVTMYQNTAFRFKMLIPDTVNRMYSGAQNVDETSDINIEGGVQIDFYPGYKLDVYGSAYTPGVPNYQEAEDFVTYSGLRGKIYIEKNQGKNYVSMQIYGTDSTISANLIGGLPETEYIAAKTAFLKLLRGISIEK